MPLVDPPSGLSYAPPQLSFAGLDKLAENYYQGAEQRRKYDLERVFQGGLPTDPRSGQTDFRAVAEQLAKHGDYSQLPALSNLAVKREFLGEAQRQEGEAAGVPQITPAQPPVLNQPRPYAPQPVLSSTGTDNRGAQTTRSMASEVFGERDVTPLIPRFAAAFKVDPDAPLSPEQEKLIRTRMVEARGSMPPQQQQPQVLPQPQAPTSAAPQIGAVLDPSLGGLVPKPFLQKYGNEAAGKWIDYAFKQARLYSLAGEKEAAGGWEKRAQDVAVALQKASEPTPTLKDTVASGFRSPLEFQGAQERQKVTAQNQAMTEAEKNARASGQMSPLEFQKREAQQKEDITRYGKQLAAIQGSAQAANRQLQHIQMAEALYNDPNFWSGSFENVNLGYKKLMNVIDPNNKEAVPQEAFRKTMAAAVLNQVEQLKDDTAAVGGGGRIFQSQIELMEKAANNPDNTVAANRLLTEVAKRGALEAKRIAAMANKYKGGHLDAEFAQKVDDYYTEHPMFTPAEMVDVRLIAPPSFQNHKQAEAANLPSGTPIKIGGDWYKSP